MTRVLRAVVAATALAFTGAMIEAPMSEVSAQAAATKQARGKKAKPATRRAAVPEPPGRGAATAPAMRDPAGGSGGGGSY